MHVGSTRATSLASKFSASHFLDSWTWGDKIRDWSWSLPLTQIWGSRPYIFRDMAYVSLFSPSSPDGFDWLQCVMLMTTLSHQVRSFAAPTPSTHLPASTLPTSSLQLASQQTRPSSPMACNNRISLPSPSPRCFHP